MALVAWLPFALSITVAFASAIAFMHVCNGKALSFNSFGVHLRHTDRRRHSHTHHSVAQNKPFSERMLTEIDTSLMIALGLGFVVMWALAAVFFVRAFW